MVARFYRYPPTESTNSPISTSDKLLKASSSLYLLHISWRSAHHIFPGFRLCCLFLVIIKDFQHYQGSRNLAYMYLHYGDVEGSNSQYFFFQTIMLQCFFCKTNWLSIRKKKTTQNCMLQHRAIPWGPVNYITAFLQTWDPSRYLGEPIPKGLLEGSLHRSETISKKGQILCRAMARQLMIG